VILAWKKEASVLLANEIPIFHRFRFGKKTFSLLQRSGRLSLSA